MHAKQAKEIAINSELNRLFLQIKNAAENGHFCIYSEKLDTEVVAALEAWGYQVDLGQSRTCHYIYWVTA